MNIFDNAALLSEKYELKVPGYDEPVLPVIMAWVGACEPDLALRFEGPRLCAEGHQKTLVFLDWSDVGGNAPVIFIPSDWDGERLALTPCSGEDMDGQDDLRPAQDGEPVAAWIKALTDDMYPVANLLADSDGALDLRFGGPMVRDLIDFAAS